MAQVNLRAASKEAVQIFTDFLSYYYFSLVFSKISFLVWLTPQLASLLELMQWKWWYHTFSAAVKALYCFQLTTELHLKKDIGARIPYKQEAQVNSVEDSANKENQDSSGLACG